MAPRGIAILIGCGMPIVFVVSLVMGAGLAAAILRSLAFASLALALARANSWFHERYGGQRLDELIATALMAVLFTWLGFFR